MMEITFAFGVVNWWAVLLATLASFVIEGIWYSPALFGGPWRAEINIPKERTGERNITAIFVLTFLLLWLTASLIAAVLGPNSDLRYGLTVGLLAGMFFVGTTMGITYILEAKPLSLFAINAGYHITAFAVMGMIIGAWH